VSWRSDDGWRSTSGRAIAEYRTPPMSEAPLLQTDVAVVGAGGAGLYAALSASAEGASVVLVSATPLARTASYWAQGGIAAALAPDDSPDLHRHDTEVAGRGLVRPSAAAVLCREAPWSRTPNPPGSIGIGALLARAAGAAIADLELIQFHPTAVTGIAGREGFLVTEAIRGEGATILDHDGERFVEELAPRDEVARAVDAKMRETGTTHMWLDMRAVDPGHFPNVVSALQEAGLDPTSDLV